MTKDEMLERMSSAEITEQMAYDGILAYERDKARSMEEKGMRAR